MGDQPPVERHSTSLLSAPGSRVESINWTTSDKTLSLSLSTRFLICFLQSELLTTKRRKTCRWQNAKIRVVGEAKILLNGITLFTRKKERWKK
jgi:hypothetical protein